MNKNELNVMSEQLIAQQNKIAEDISIAIGEKQVTLDRVMNEVVDNKDANKAIKKVRSDHNKATLQHSKQVKELEARVIEVFVDPVREDLNKYEEVIKQITSTADTKSKEFETNLSNERMEFVNNTILMNLQGFGFNSEDKTVDKIVGLIDGSLLRPLTTSDTQVQTKIGEWFVSTVELCENFDITFDEFSEYNFSERKYNAHLADELRRLQDQAKAKSEDDKVVAKPSVSVKVSLDEKLNKKKSPQTRKTFREQAVAKRDEMFDIFEQAGLTNKEIEVFVSELI